MQNIPWKIYIIGFCWEVKNDRKNDEPYRIPSD
jgi:hypothetical protein